MGVYENLTGPGTTCLGVMEDRRVCTDSVLDSLLVVRPLTNEPGSTDPHPVDIFPSVEEPNLALIIRWITEGAKFEP